MDSRSSTCSAVNEFERLHVHPNEGRTLIVGSRVYVGREDRRKLYSHAEGWDAQAGGGVDRVVDFEQCDALPMVTPFDHIECISVLEHSKRPWLIAKSIKQLMRHGATIYLAVPFVWRVHAYPDDYWRFTVSGVVQLFPFIAWKKLCYAHLDMSEEVKSPAVTVHDYVYLARTQVCGFGVKA